MICSTIVCVGSLFAPKFCEPDDVESDVNKYLFGIAIILISLFAKTPAPAPETTDFNVVTQYGAICDGKTDDTEAVGKAVNAFLAKTASSGSSAGSIYFPPMAHPCLFNGSVLNQTYYGSGMKVHVANTLLASGPLTTSTWMEIKCEPTASMGFIKSTPQFKPAGYIIAAGNNAVLSISGNVQQDYFDGCAFLAQGANSTVSPVQITSTAANGGNAPTFLTFINSAINSNNAPIPAIQFSVANKIGNGGYNAALINSTIACPSGTLKCVQLDNFGIVRFERDAIFGGTVYVTNATGTDSGHLVFDDVNSEGLKNQDFLMLDSSGGGAISGVKLNHVNLADTVGNVYVIGGRGTRNDDIEIDQTATSNWGMGILDPSTPLNGLAGVTCFGHGCANIPNTTPRFVLSSFPSLMLRDVKPFMSCDGGMTYAAFAFSDGKSWKCY